MPPELRAGMDGLRRRVRFLMAERYGFYGASIGAVAASVMALLCHKIPELLDYRLWVGSLILGGLCGTAIGLTRKIGDVAIAVSADKRAGLKERVSTAVSIESSSKDGEVERALIADAAEHVGRMTPAEVFRHKWASPHIAFGISIVLLISTAVLPGLGIFQSKTRREEVAVMKSEGRKMVEVAKEIRKDSEGAKREELRRLAARLEKLGRQMQTGRMDKKQAMLRTKQLSDKVKAEQDRLAAENARSKSMEQAQEEMRKSGMGLAKKMAEEMAKSEHISEDQAMKKIPSDKRLAELARKSGALTPKERLDVEKSLEKYADSKNQRPIPAEVGEALAKLAANKDYMKAAEIMQKLALKMQSGKMSNLDREALQRQMKELAKALQHTDLDKLAKQMLDNAEKLAKMSPEELAKLIKQAEENERMAGSLKKAGGT